MKEFLVGVILITIAAAAVVQSLQHGYGAFATGIPCAYNLQTDLYCVLRLGVEPIYAC